MNWDLRRSSKPILGVKTPDNYLYFIFITSSQEVLFSNKDMYLYKIDQFQMALIEIDVIKLIYLVTQKSY